MQSLLVYQSEFKDWIDILVKNNHGEEPLLLREPDALNDIPRRAALLQAGAKFSVSTSLVPRLL